MKLFKAYRKTLAVIRSCETTEHFTSAKKYVELFKKRYRLKDDSLLLYIVDKSLKNKLKQTS